jgi:hypothetical protein
LKKYWRNKLELLKKYYPYITALFVFIVYMITMAPSVMQIDTGELAAVQTILGIAHPTGYPLFTMLGYLFLQIPLPVTKIFQSNILAALYCAGAIVFFLKSFELILNHISIPVTVISKEKKKKGKTNTVQAPIILKDLEKYFVLITTALIIAFNETFWQQSTSTEVYSLQALLFAIILFSAVKFFTNEKPGLKDYLFLSASVALGFTNHMTTLLFIPGLTYLFFAKTGFSKDVIRKIIFMAILFAGVIVLFYSYLFIRASQNPELNWGNPFNFENFLRHVTGKQYQVWMFSSLEEAKKQLALYVTNLPSVFAYLPLIFSFAGLIQLYKLSRKLFTFLFITYLFSVFYVINYSIHDISSYFLLSHIILALFAGFGIIKIFILIKEKYKSVYTGLAVICIVPLLVFILNFGKVNSSGIYTYEDYTKAILKTMPQNSIIFSYQWDYFLASSYYFQKVEKYRNDVAIIDKELLRRSWYYNQMERNIPEVIKNIKPEINSFLEAIRPFEQSKIFDANLLEKLYQTIMTKLISENISTKDYFIGPELIDKEIRGGEFTPPSGCSLAPYGLLIKVVPDNNYAEGPVLDFKIRFPKERDEYITFIYNQVGSMLSNRAKYELDFNKKDKAREIILKLRNELPDYVIPAELIEKLNSN